MDFINSHGFPVEPSFKILKSLAYKTCDECVNGELDDLILVIIYSNI